MLSRRTMLLSALAAPAVVPAIAKAQDDPITVLQLQRRSIEVGGKAASVFGIRQRDGTSGIATTIAKPFRVRLENQIDQPSLIHWHGLTPPWQQDGVPGISAPAIKPGGSADYDFPLRFGGTFWMHSHQGFQEQLLMTAPLIIRDPRDRSDEQEVVVMLADFSFTPPEQIMAELQKGMAMPMGGKTPAPGMANMPGMSMGGAPAAPDLNDVKYDAFLANDRTLADPEVIKLEPGARVRLRVINGSSMSAYHIDLGNLDGELIAVDGLPVAPVKGRIFPITVAQRLDIRVMLPRAPGAHPILAVLEGKRNRTGIVLLAGRAPVARISDMAAKPSAALTLDLESRLHASEPLKPRKADRVHKLALTGSMMNYVWSINNVVWTPATLPLALAAGERVELVLTNRTPMPHPMHLHGHPFQVVAIDGKRFAGAMRDTVLVPPSRQVVVAFDANNPGHWAFHCHLLYHMEAGMFATFRYV